MPNYLVTAAFINMPMVRTNSTQSIFNNVVNIITCKLNCHYIEPHKLHKHRSCDKNFMNTRTSETYTITCMT